MTPNGHGTLMRDLAKRCTPYMFTTLLVCQLLGVVGIARRSTPNVDEPAHLSAGLYHWQTGCFDAYRVNPPLVRLWCTWPLSLSHHVPRVTRAVTDGHARLEWQIDDLLWSHWTFADLRNHLLIARLMTLPFCVLGGIYCWRWGTAAYGRTAGWAAWVLWISSPNLLAWSATLCPDVAATSLGLAACFHFRQWKLSSRLDQLWLAGLLSGLAILAKSTWFVLPVLMTTTAICMRCGGRRFALRHHQPSCSSGLCGLSSPYRRGRHVGQLLLACCLIIAMVNLGYGLKDTGPRLGELPFRSRLLTTARDQLVEGHFLSRYAKAARIPLPRDFLLGIDQQRFDFEQRKWSYLAGRWRFGSWPHYYLACAFWKMPTGVLGLLMLSFAVSLGERRRSLASGCSDARRDVDAALFRWFGGGLMIVISSQCGFGHHFRYAFPCLPFAWLHASACFGQTSPRWLRLVAATLLVWAVTSSYASWPLSHSYFNELATWSFRTPPVLESNLEWGEDLDLAAEWLRQNVTARPAFHAVVADDIAQRMPLPWRPAPAQRAPGWYVVSLQRLLDPRDRFSDLLTQPAVTMLGDSLRIYHVKEPRDSATPKQKKKPPQPGWHEVAFARRKKLESD